MTFNKAFKFRIIPNNNQEILLQKSFGCSRFIWNIMLSEIRDNYNNNIKAKFPTPAKYKKEFAFLKEVDAFSLCNAQLQLQQAFRNFQKNPKHFGLPNFKSKKVAKKSYTTNMSHNNIKIYDKHIKLPKLGNLRVKFHRQIPNDYKIKSCTISQSPSGKYYISILTEFQKQITPKIIKEKNQVIGLDMSLENLFTDSQGAKNSYPRFYRSYQNKLSREQRKLSKKVKKSNNYFKQRRKISILHEKIRNCRLDYLHKLSRNLVDNYDLICIEDLDLKEMSNKDNHGKSIHDNGWSIFITLLAYKLELEGKNLQKIDRYFPSSKRCNNCGHVNKDLGKYEKNWKCSSCDMEHDRDHNASKNIKEEGIRKYELEKNRRDYGDSLLKFEEVIFH